MTKKLIIIILLVLLVYAIGGVVYKYVGSKNPNPNEKEPLITIKNYNYSLNKKATFLQKEQFNILKENLESNNINKEEYAKSIAKLFIIDLYTLDNKINKYDIGGVEYVLPNYLENFKLNVNETLYDYLEDNSNNNRSQELPEVNNISISTFEKNEYQLNDINYEGYKISLTWEYTKDLGYDSSGDVIVIFYDSKYYVTEKI